ncbi:NADH dehydrogenase (quinone) subunit D [Sulfobacillus thermosulfidooxidans]|uniref:NADH-quinone oxidoreductase subunit D n=2 Tax=Sulfobacillus thermosulfidooxidans TaxID=28034 RepID=A0A1W1WGH1_SULTA|nr:NADH dehydrogenase (quinone) subunit D [Sulfobacillus thermosulfidooxidans]OLZ08687.1 NADH dehydrogenase [Sulfobacillus thermosulfidooxidans]OLZ17310.1 NADH dehydrogenase [Sulfobacillus thermosulfidooxidans]OLZ19373.1 NADH dehydrogenase [Sulfobacillus thermosulfidooxidans]PSR27263.1 MAG: NADH dehydrogenase (quinone) subunit D [Sulfobacillus thermosulfidooxidans]SMC05279.1 NADH dehydrogenase subunit D [Sulfobacillus thermosulfidooxidans DSM 9293]
MATEKPELLETSERSDTMIINLGPQHPSTHGVLRVRLELDGERVVHAEPVVGYLHTGFEKTAENLTYQQCNTITDRLDYLAPMTNNLAYVLAVEKLLNVEVPKRAQYIRVLFAELTRVASHLVWLGTHVMDLGAMSLFFYTMREREVILDLIEAVSGVRMNPSYFRIGGLAYDLPEGFHEKVYAFIKDFPRWMKTYRHLFDGNPLINERLQGIAVLTQEDALALSVTGPNLRATGMPLDLRKDEPYSSYEDFEFNVPIRTECDAYARFWVRVEEMYESMKIIEQAIDKIEPKGPYTTSDRKISLPPREEIYGNMEALIHQFKLVTQGFPVPAGEVYQGIEGPRGEIGFYIVSDGGSKPYRWRARTPSFYNLQSLPQMCEGGLVADVITAIGSIDIMLGDVDK